MALSSPYCRASGSGILRLQRRDERGSAQGDEVIGLQDVPLPPIEFIHLVGGPDEFHFNEAGKGVAALVRGNGLLSSGAKFLDVGCGCGRVAKHLLNDPLSSYEGFDRHKPMIEWASANITPIAPHFRFSFFDAESVYSDWDNHKGSIPAEKFVFPYEDEAFDSALLSSVFSHMPIGEIEAYCRQLRRVMSPGGKIIASVIFTGDNPPHHGDFHYDRVQFEEVFKRAGLAAELIITNIQSWYLLQPNG